MVGNVVNQFYFGPLPVIAEVLELRLLTKTKQNKRKTKLSWRWSQKFGLAQTCDPEWLADLDRTHKEILCFPLSACVIFVGLCGEADGNFMEVKIAMGSSSWELWVLVRCTVNVHKLEVSYGLHRRGWNGETVLKEKAFFIPFYKTSYHLLQPSQIALVASRVNVKTSLGKWKLSSGL